MSFFPMSDERGLETTRYCVFKIIAPAPRPGNSVPDYSFQGRLFHMYLVLYLRKSYCFEEVS